MVVSNKTKCDVLYEALDSLYFDRLAVATIRDYVNRLRRKNEESGFRSHEDIEFFKKLKDSPMDAVKSMIGIILLVVIFVVAYAMSSDAPMLINNKLYNESSMLVMTDTFIYVQYVLLFVCALATLVSLTGVLKSVNKVKA